MRYLAALVLLTLAGFNGLLAWTVDTCTGNVADAPLAGVLTLPLNVVGMMLLAWRPTIRPLVATAALPTALAIPYTAKSLQLASAYWLQGQGVCDVVSPYGPWRPNGEEPMLLALWLGTVAVFWLGLAISIGRAYRGGRKDEIVERAS